MIKFYVGENEVAGMAGDLRMIMDDARQVMLAMYASPCVGRLHRVVPIADRLLPTANDEHFMGNIE